MPSDSLGLTIDRELQRRLPSASDNELRQLAANVEQDGAFFESIKVWNHNGKRYIVDGHNRYDVWINLPEDTPVPPPRIEEIPFASKHHAENWILLHQIGKRNLNTRNWKELVADLYDLELEREACEVSQPKNDKNTGGQCENLGISLIPDPNPRARETVAAQIKTSPASVARAKAYGDAIKAIRHVNPKAASDIQAKILKISEPDTIALSKSNDIGKGIRNLRQGRKWNDPGNNGAGTPPSEDEWKTQQRKTIKTAEALSRAFDDLNELKPNVSHGDVQDTCKELLTVAREWSND